VLFLMIRMGNPDLWHPVTGGEKPMDFAYLNAVIKSAYFPPYDPWYAGGYINYYYFGQVVAATLIKLAGIVPWVGYNLAVPLFYSLSALGAFAAVYHLVLRRGDAVCRSATAYGLLGPLFLGLMGNLAEVRLIARTLAKLSTLGFQSTIPGLGVLINSMVGLYRVVLQAQPLSARTEWWYWNATRAIAAASDEVGPINEFPFFTYLYGDLHAHLIALPFALLVMVVAIGWMRSWSSGSMVHAHGATVSGLVRASLAGLCIGVLWVTNTWDYPTYMLVMLAALAAGLFHVATRSGSTWTMGDALRAFGWRAAVLVGVSYGSFLPFHLSYVPGYTSIERWRGSQTRLDDYLIMHGLFLFVLATFLIAHLLRREHGDGPAGLLRMALARWERLPRLAHLYRLLVREPSLWYLASVWGMVAVVCCASLMLILGPAVIALSLPMISLGALLLIWRSRQSPVEHILIFIILLAWALTLVVELVVLKGDIGRMNTVFKFYLQVWVLWALATAAVLPRIQRWLRHWPRCSSCWRAVFVLLLLGCLLYVPLATQAKVSDRFDRSIGPTLDGMAYMASATYQEGESELQLEWDRQAMRWMLANIQGSPVVLEANVLLYRWGSRVSIYTGLPTIVGWDWHQRQQRGHIAGEAVNRRVREVQEIYGTTDLERAQQLLRQYRVKYIYLGELEHAVYPVEGLGKFERWVDDGFLREVYRNAGVVLYEVTGQP
jgi:YYY domain-containing protein